MVPAPARTFPAARVAAATTAVVFLAAVALATLPLEAPSLTADSGMMGGLWAPFVALAVAGVLMAAVICAAWAAGAVVLARRRAKPWLGIAMALAGWVMLAVAFGVLLGNPAEGWRFASWAGAPVSAGVLAALLADTAWRRSIPWNLAADRGAPMRQAAAQAQARASDVGRVLDAGLQHWATRVDGGTRWRAVVERRALLLLIFCGFAAFTLFAILAIGDVAPWFVPQGYVENPLNAVLWAGGQPWLRLALLAIDPEARLALAWISALAVGLNAALLAALAFAALARPRA